jgi:hypothetical protein
LLFNIKGFIFTNKTESVIKGKIRNKEMTLHEVKIYFSILKENYKPSNKNFYEEFRLLANGF